VPRPYKQWFNSVGATHRVALAQEGGLRDEGEAVPRPYK